MCTIDIDATSTPCTVRLSGDLNIYHAVAARDALLPLVAQHRSLVVDLAGVGEFDTAGVQVLLAGRRDAAAGGGEIRLAGRSKSVVQVLDAMNLSGMFDDAGTDPAAR